MASVTYVELNVPDLAAAAAFYRAAFNWDLVPFGGPDYLVAQHGQEPGIDAGLLAAEDGAPRTVAVITVPSLDDALASVEAHGGAIVVPRYTIPTVGHVAYFTDPGGLLVGLHQRDPQAT